MDSVKITWLRDEVIREEEGVTLYTTVPPVGSLASLTQNATVIPSGIDTATEREFGKLTLGLGLPNAGELGDCWAQHHQSTTLGVTSSSTVMTFRV